MLFGHMRHHVVGKTANKMLTMTQKKIVLFRDFGIEFRYCFISSCGLCQV